MDIVLESIDLMKPLAGGDPDLFAGFQIEDLAPCGGRKYSDRFRSGGRQRCGCIAIKLIRENSLRFTGVFSPY